MSKYTPAQYAESARKHGIPCGPYDRKTDSMYHVRIFNSPTGSELATVHYRGDHVEREQDRFAWVLKSLPDLLIALDEKDAEIERLVKGLQAVDVAFYNRSQGMKSQSDEQLHKVVVAALEGGAA